VGRRWSAKSEGIITEKAIEGLFAGEPSMGATVRWVWGHIKAALTLAGARAATTWT
jgi:hypothetical protein